MSADDGDLEAEIVSRFLENIHANADISEEAVGFLMEVSDEPDFGGREYLADRILEVKG